MNVRDTMNLLAMVLDETTFRDGGGMVPRSYPYLALQGRGVDLETYQIALTGLAGIGLVVLTPDTIAPGPAFSELAPKIKAAAEAHRAASGSLCEYCASGGARGIKSGGACVGCGVGRVARCKSCGLGLAPNETGECRDCWGHRQDVMERRA